MSPCKGPLCPILLPRAGWCDKHQHLAPKVDRSSYFQTYDEHQRNPQARRFYNSAVWEHARRTKLSSNPVCEECGREWANTVHHEKPFIDCSVAERTSQDNLMAVCASCHGKIEAAVRAVKAVA